MAAEAALVHSAVKADPRLIVPLDLPTVDEARAMVDALGDAVSFYKVGLELFAGGEGMTLARELNLTAARLSAWRDRALVAAEAAMKERERDVRDEEMLRLQAKLGEVTMANELLERRIAALEGGRPLARRRSKR